jgi:hypothetical protein
LRGSIDQLWTRRNQLLDDDMLDFRGTKLQLDDFRRLSLPGDRRDDLNVTGDLLRLGGASGFQNRLAEAACCDFRVSFDHCD